MPKYLVERDMPNLGSKNFEEIQGLARKAVDAIEAIGSNVCWIQSFSTENKVYSIYSAPNETVIRDVSKKAGLPITNITEILLAFDPTIAEVGKRAPSQFKPAGR